MPGYGGKNQRGGGYSNENAAFFITDTLQPRSNLVINEVKLAQMQVGRIDRVIFRMKGPGIMDDDHAYAKHKDAKLFAGAIFAMAPAGCWHYIGNEFGSDDIAGQDQWTLECVEHGAQLMFTHKRPFIPLVHNNFTQHFRQGEAGWRACKRSIEAAMALGGGVGPHIYPSGSVQDELKRSPNAFDALDQIRQVYGEALTIIISEFSVIDRDDPYKGPRLFMSASQFADETEAAAEIFRKFRADFLIFGEFEMGTEWEPFNTREEPKDAWATEYNKRLVSLNRRFPVDDYGSRNAGGSVELIGGATGVNLRRAPVNGSVITVLRGGEQLDAYYTKSDAGWWQVEYRGELAYCSSNLTRIVATLPPVVNELPPFPSSKDEAKNWQAVFKEFETAGQMGQQLFQRWIDAANSPS